MIYNTSIYNRLWAGINVTDDPNDCHVWIRARSTKGYGSMGTYTGRTARVSRLVMEFHLGRYLSPDEKVLHSCDNPPCCNIRHLRIGTQADNIIDMFARGRATRARGESHGNAVLTEKQVKEIKERLLAGESGYGLDREFGVSLGTSSAIKHGKVWTWVT